LGYFFLGGGFQTVAQFDIAGCISYGVNQPQLQISANAVSSDVAGNYVGSITYTDSLGNLWQPTQAAANVELLTAPMKVGDGVDGFYSGAVTYNGQIKMLAGKFHICRIPDFAAP
jgi:hypothetical protein